MLSLLIALEKSGFQTNQHGSPWKTNLLPECYHNSLFIRKSLRLLEIPAISRVFPASPQAYVPSTIE
jgi:hypothetical protein